MYNSSLQQSFVNDIHKNPRNVLRTSFVLITQSYTGQRSETGVFRFGKDYPPTYAPPSLSPTLVQPLIFTSLANARLSPQLSPSQILSRENTDGCARRRPWSDRYRSVSEGIIIILTDEYIVRRNTRTKGAYRTQFIIQSRFFLDVDLVGNDFEEAPRMGKGMRWRYGRRRRGRWLRVHDRSNEEKTKSRVLTQIGLT